MSVVVDLFLLDLTLTFVHSNYFSHFHENLTNYCSHFRQISKFTVRNYEEECAMNFIFVISILEQQVIHINDKLHVLFGSCRKYFPEIDFTDSSSFRYPNHVNKPYEYITRMLGYIIFVNFRILKNAHIKS